MEKIVTSVFLMIFLIWAHKALLKCHSLPSKKKSPPLSDNNSSNPKRFAAFFSLISKLITKLAVVKHLLLTVLLFLGCYYFVTYHAWTQNNANTNTTKTDYDNDAKEDDSKKPVNNLIEILPPNKVKTKFSDVAGMEEVKEEVQDIIQFLRNPGHFSRLGAKSPRGLLMHGAPGTGKTLVARAMAGESNVSFISVSGSQFEEEYIGVGASRVRQLFQLARSNSPCIIFIDEVDTVAFKRNSGGKNAPWLAQTINQLLAEMDGLNEDKNSGIIVIAATNRMEVLDPAILRPGRFDRQVKLELPTLVEREAILQVHLKNIKTDPSVKTNEIAKLTTGFSGADLANLGNEAAIHATKNHKKAVASTDFDYARDRVILGSKREALKMNAKERKITAYHEAGHALVAMALSEHEPLYKVTISPRGMTLGHTAFQPEMEKYSYSKRHIEQTIASTLGGRIAELLIFGEDDITTGAEGDFKAASNLAYKMVTQWGFSKQLKNLNDPEMQFSDKKIISQEMQEILDKNHSVAKNILEKNIDKLHNLAKALLEKETLAADEVNHIVGKIR